MDNIKLESGDEIPKPSSSSETLNFDMLNFDDIEMVCLKKSNNISQKKNQNHDERKNAFNCD